MFEDFFDMLAGLSGSAHLVQLFDSTIIRANVSTGEEKAGIRAKRSAARAAALARKST